MGLGCTDAFGIEHVTAQKSADTRLTASDPDRAEVPRLNAPCPACFRGIHQSDPTSVLWTLKACWRISTGALMGWIRSLYLYDVIRCLNGCSGPGLPCHYTEVMGRAEGGVS